MSEFDVYTRHHIQTPRDGELEMWKHTSYTAADIEQVIARISALRIRGSFRVYPREERADVRAHVVELYEVERLR